MSLQEHPYVEMFERHPWWPAISWCHEELTKLCPDYTVDQVKEKFGGLRYYFSVPEGTPDEIRTKMDHIVHCAEMWVAGYEAGCSS
jgi:hypothetical protein